MRVGVGLGNQTPGVAWASIPRRAELAEELGFSSLATVGRIAFPGLMDTVALAAAAGATRRIGLFTGILVAPSWGPALLAKELASIDAVSGGRLTVGLGIGSRTDDYPDQPPGHRGDRLDHDLQVYAAVWRGERLGDADEPLMPAGARPPDLVFGGVSDAAMARMARAGVGYLGASWSPALVAPLFARAREAWADAGRPGAPRLRALTYAALTDPRRGLAAIGDYYADRPTEIAGRFTGAVCTTAEQLTAVASAYAELGVEELLVNPAVPGEDELWAIAQVLPNGPEPAR